MKNAKTANRALAAALTLVLFLCSCDVMLPSLEYDKEKNDFTNKKTGVAYVAAPDCYEPAETGEACAKWKNEFETVLFSKVKGADPAEIMAEQYGTLFRAEGTKLPELSEMETREILICVESENPVALVSIEDREHIGKIVDAWENGYETEYPAASPVRNLRVRFCSDKYPAFFFKLIYLEYGDGAKRLYCRDTGRCVDAGELIGEYLDGKYS